MKHNDKNKLVSAGYFEWQASLFGACFIAFGLGIVLSRYVAWLTWPSIALGIIVHSYGMRKIYNRNK